MPQTAFGQCVGVVAWPLQTPQPVHGYGHQSIEGWEPLRTGDPFRQEPPQRIRVASLSPIFQAQNARSQGTGVLADANYLGDIPESFAAATGTFVRADG